MSRFSAANWLKKNGIKCAWLALLAPNAIMATDLVPWYAKMFEIRPCAEYTYQYFRTVDSSRKDFQYPSYDNFLNLGIGIPIFQYHAQAEILLADTRHRSFGVDCYRLTGRYQIFDDVSGENAFSAVVGATLTKATKVALHDIGSFHHAQLEGEIHLAIGKENASGEFWDSRYWGLLGIGLGDVGSPWLRCNAIWEKNYCDIYAWGLSLHTLWGFGGNRISHHHFKGYGPVQHQSIDAMAFFSYNLACGGEIQLEYGYRVYAKNFPKNSNLFRLSFCYPFGL